ncbi:MAG: SDR family oxidoreductase [Elusimicrobia bacterium]|jgi:NAD(P)-dependent dehydrogenase (short-subunit alcohol dehydrogenase family)|nr:SDR family oxidoreductase [Elusimicrobiota bacterium]
MQKKHSLIIGGTRGIGRALVDMWSEHGDRFVSVVGRHSANAIDRRLLRVDHWRTDLTEGRSLGPLMADIIRRRGALSSLVFFQRYRGIKDDWMGELQVSLTATREILERTGDYFDPAGERAIVVISSIANHFIAREQSVGYHVAKAGLTQMVRYYAVKFGAKKIRVNSVSPGPVVKAESEKFYQRHPGFTAFYKTIIPLGRIGTMKEIASTVDFLCSPKASFITGQDLVVDGGVSIQAHESLARSLTPLGRIKVTRS